MANAKTSTAHALYTVSASNDASMAVPGAPDSANAPKIADDSDVIGWLLYDGGCGICRQGVSLWRRGLRNRKIGNCPLQNAWVQSQLGPLTEAELISDVRLLFRDGQQLRGANVYRYLFKRIWWAYPLYILSRIPPFNWAFDRIYKLIAANRHTISHSCKIST